MVNVSPAFKEAIKQPVVTYKFTGTIGTHNFTEDNIVEGSCHISHQCTNSDEIVLGSSYMGKFEATFTGINISRYNWYLKRIVPTFQLKLLDGSYEAIEMGVYIVKEVKHSAEGTHVVAYDRMVKFGRKFMHSRYNYIAKPYTFLSQLCSECDVTLDTTQAQIEAMRNGERKMYIFGTLTGTKDYDNDIERCWDAVYWLAQTLGGYAVFNRHGHLEIRQYGNHVVDTISEEHRLEGAVFDDYITNFTGLYVDNMDDGTDSYYGYDETELQDQLNELMTEIAGYMDDISDIQTEIGTLEGDIEDINTEEYNIGIDLNALRLRYENGEITLEEYLEQKAVLDERYDQLEVQKAQKQAQIAEKQEDIKDIEDDINLDEKYIAWLEKALEKAQDGDEGSSMILGANPFVQRVDESGESANPMLMRRAILKSLDKMCYTPFSCSTVVGVHYDLGDCIKFTGGHADNDICCLMCFDWTLNGEYTMQGWGTDTDQTLVKSKASKQASRAQKTATKAENNATSGGSGTSATFNALVTNNFQLLDYTEVQ